MELWLSMKCCLQLKEQAQSVEESLLLSFDGLNKTLIWQCEFRLRVLCVQKFLPTLENPFWVF